MVVREGWASRPARWQESDEEQYESDVRSIVDDEGSDFVCGWWNLRNGQYGQSFIACPAACRRPMWTLSANQSRHYEQCPARAEESSRTAEQYSVSILLTFHCA